MANAGEHTNSANSVPPATSPLAPNTYDAFSDTNNSDSTEQTVVIPKYGPVDSPGPSQKPYTAAHTSKFRKQSIGDGYENRRGEEEKRYNHGDEEEKRPDSS
ncbi:hypothetical protein E3N88_42298 [Mikania micrantha]|uniref:Uncharacterized protein n=1 Tax=Mikania micrantha TaxID=192012 RepID=A0A5N6LI69_9ASTR|nr:hypothetical protein E3N88_42298 [Mikania micrantha]